MQWVFVGRARYGRRSDVRMHSTNGVLGQLALTIAGALLGRKAVSASTLGRATTAARGMGRIGRAAAVDVRASPHGPLYR